MSHHELEIVDDHVGDVVHVDCVLHGVNHCPEQGRPGSAPGISGGRDGNAEPGKGTQRKSWKVPGWVPMGPGHIPPLHLPHCITGATPSPQVKVAGQEDPAAAHTVPANAPSPQGFSGHMGMHAGATVPGE